MLGTSTRSRTAQGSFARCEAVVAVLAALLLLPCADGMMMADSTTPGANVTMTVDAATTGSSMAMVRVEADRPGPGDLGGVRATCLVSSSRSWPRPWGLRPARPRIVAEMLTRGSTAIRRVIRVRAPNLAQLCLLRT